MAYNFSCLFTWLTFLGVIISTPLYLCGFMENALIPIFAAIALPPLAYITFRLELQRRQNPTPNETDTNHTNAEGSHGSEDGGKAEEILNRIVENLRVFVAIDANGLEVHVFTLDGETYYHLQPRGNGGYIIDLNPTMEVQRAVDLKNEIQSYKDAS